MNKVSKGATAGFEILTHAVEDIISNLSSKAAKNVRIRSSNITQWQRGLLAQSAHPWSLGPSTSFMRPFSIT